MDLKPDTVANIRHESTIFSLALSRDERLLACGGTDAVPITVWNLDDGVCLGRFKGLKRQAHALAFSQDGARLAAANLWGAQCVWRLGDGEVLEEKEGGSARQTRTLVYPASSAEHRLVMLSGSISGGKPERTLAPNGLAIADTYRGVRVLKYRTTRVVAELERDRSLLMKPGVRARAWSGDSRVLALSGDGWAGAWMPFEEGGPVFLSPLPSADQVNVIAALNDPRRILYADQSNVRLLEFPEAPLRASVRTAFEEFMSRLEEPAAEPPFLAQRTWKWGFTNWGYHAVDTQAGELIWYSMSGGRDGGAAVQTFESFLRDGPAGGSPPGPMLREIAQAVRILSRERESDAKG